MAIRDESCTPIADRLRMMSDERREAYWPNRPSAEMKQLWALPKPQIYDLLPLSERRYRCPRCASIISQFGSSTARCHDQECGTNYQGRVHCGDFDGGVRERRGSLKQMAIPDPAQNAYVSGESE